MSEVTLISVRSSLLLPDVMEMVWPSMCALTLMVRAMFPKSGLS